MGLSFCTISVIFVDISTLSNFNFGACTVCFLCVTLDGQAPQRNRRPQPGRSVRASPLTDMEEQHGRRLPTALAVLRAAEVTLGMHPASAPTFLSRWLWLVGDGGEELTGRPQHEQRTPQRHLCPSASSPCSAGAPCKPEGEGILNLFATYLAVWRALRRTPWAQPPACSSAAW